MKIPIDFDQTWIDPFTERLQADAPWDDYALFQLALEAEKNTLIPDFGKLACLDYLTHLHPFPHQVQTAQQVITDMNGKAILADEVGLGKTIEAGLILKEYMLRGLVQRALILVPASLVSQWTSELNEKMRIPAVAQNKAYMWKQIDILVASMDTAKRAPHREHVLEQEYDLLIIDEAHRLKNKKTCNYQFVSQIQKKFCLLLTATPMQNELQELFNLVSLLKPGFLGNMSEFQKRYMHDKRTAKNETQLHQLLQKVMIRNRRKDGTIDLPSRKVMNIELYLSEPEQQLYREVSDFVRTYTKEHAPRANIFTMLTLQREICSSREATFMTLQKMAQYTQNKAVHDRLNELMNMIRSIQTHSKAEKTIELIRSIEDKVIIFTEYRATQFYLQHKLHEHGITSVPFRGGFKRSKKEWMKQLFEHNAQVLIATEAGSEGINLQFCQHMINYDLPWNPMKLEQRIGRIHRLGQTEDVHIYNLSTKGTIEEYMLYLLFEKINMFEMVVGELEQIIAKMGPQTLFEGYLQDIFIHSASHREMEIKLSNLGGYMHSLQTNKSSEPKERILP